MPVTSHCTDARDSTESDASTSYINSHEHKETSKFRGLLRFALLDGVKCSKCFKHSEAERFRW